MVFCNKVLDMNKEQFIQGHNPYFNRWFSAIEDTDFPNNSYVGHNPYFNRWFSAIINKLY